MATKVNFNLRESKVLLNIPLSPSKNINFIPGDLVRSYRCAFSEELPYKNNFIEGVVISVRNDTPGDRYLLVKWYLDYFFGIKYSFKMPIDGRDTFEISILSPHLVKINKTQLFLNL